MLPEPNRFTSFRQYGEFQIRARRPLLELSRVRLAHLVAVVGTDQSQKGEADELALAVTHGAGRGWIHVGEQTGRITRINQILRAFESRAKLADLLGGKGLAEARVGVASSLRLGRELEPSGGRAVDVEGSVELTEGTKHAVDASADVGGVTVDLAAQCLLSAAAGLAAR